MKKVGQGIELAGRLDIVGEVEDAAAAAMELAYTTLPGRVPLKQQ